MDERLQLIALTIWWCEGTKIRKDKRWKNAYSYAIEITNTDPKIINIFIRFLRTYLKVPLGKFHAQIQIHEGDNQKELESFWSISTGLPFSCFNKTIVRKIGNKPGKSKGTFKIRLYDKEVFRKLNELLIAQLNKLEPGSSSVG